MSNGYYEPANAYYEYDPGIDGTDQATDEYLLSEALKDEGDIYVGYYDAIRLGDGHSCHDNAPGITDLMFQQRRHRVFLLLNRFRPRTQMEAEARERAIRRYGSGGLQKWDGRSGRAIRHLVLLPQMQRGRTR